MSKLILFTLLLTSCATVKIENVTGEVQEINGEMTLVAPAERKAPWEPNALPYIHDANPHTCTSSPVFNADGYFLKTIYACQ